MCSLVPNNQVIIHAIKKLLSIWIVFWKQSYSSSSLLLTVCILVSISPGIIHSATNHCSLFQTSVYQKVGNQLNHRIIFPHPNAHIHFLNCVKIFNSPSSAYGNQLYHIPHLCYVIHNICKYQLLPEYSSFYLHKFASREVLFNRFLYYVYLSFYWKAEVLRNSKCFNKTALKKMLLKTDQVCHMIPWIGC